VSPLEGEERRKGKKEKGKEGGRKEKGWEERFSPPLK